MPFSMRQRPTYVRRLAVMLAALTLGAQVAPAGAATRGPRIGEAAAFGAPVGGKGGVTNPVTSCASYQVETRNRWVLSNADSGYSRTFRWRGTLPGIAFPRVAVGTYTSETTAWCGRHRAVRTQTLLVKQKTARTTVSPAEFRRIHRGMTAARVRHIVGYRGAYSWRWSGKTSRTYDMMAFWRWAQVVYRDGRVVEKYWDVGHD